MVSLASALLPAYFRLTRGNRTFLSAAAAERHLAARTAAPASYRPHGIRPGVTVIESTVDGWPVFTLTPSNSTPTGAVIYLHGGAWVNEIRLQHWQLASQIAAEANTTVIVPIYPLVPFGTASTVDAGVVALARAASAQHGPVALAGDSAGGQIALSAAQGLRGILSLVVLISPAVDPSMKNPQMDVVQPSDPWLAKPGNVVFLDAWRGELATDDPRINALTADAAGLDPVLMFSGTRDILNPDARLLAARLRDAGVDIEYRELPGLLHVYPLTPTREGREARALIVARLRDALHAG